MKWLSVDTLRGNAPTPRGLTWCMVPVGSDLVDLWEVREVILGRA